jgi:hypothetical protein
MWVEHDRAPPNFARKVTEFSNKIYSWRLTGRGRPLAWPHGYFSRTVHCVYVFYMICYNNHPIFPYPVLNHWFLFLRGRYLNLTNLPPSCAVVMKSGNLKLLESSGPLQACNGTALPFHIYINTYTHTHTHTYIYIYIYIYIKLHKQHKEYITQWKLVSDRYKNVPYFLAD